MKHKNSLSHLKMSKEFITFGYIEIDVEDADISYILVSNKIPSGVKNYKYFVGYL